MMTDALSVTSGTVTVRRGGRTGGMQPCYPLLAVECSPAGGSLPRGARQRAERAAPPGPPATPLWPLLPPAAAV